MVLSHGIGGIVGYIHPRQLRQVQEVSIVSWLNRQIAGLFPVWALKRQIAVQRIKRLEQFQSELRSFEAVSGNRLRYDFLSTTQGPDTAIKGDIQSLRNHVRQLEYNNGFVSGLIRRIVKNTVGQGIRFQARVRADSRRLEIPKINETTAKNFNDDAERQFARWNKQADKRLMFSFYELQKLVEGALVRDNECLVIGRKSKRRGRIIPYCLDVLEADRLMTPASEINNPSIRNGIRFDEEGVPCGFFLLRRHPGESFGANPVDDDFEEVPAFNKNGTRKVLHLFNPIRPEQTRGFTLFAAGLKDLQDLDRYMEAEKMAALEAACLTGVVESGDPMGFNTSVTGSSGSDNYDRIHEFAPGKWHYLNPGEKAEILNPSRPNESFGEYVDQLSRGPAGALDVPPEIFTQNWKGFNYSNARTVLLQFWATCIERTHYLTNHLCIPVWENVGRAMVAHGLVQAQGFDRRPDDYLRSAWIPSVYRRWVDPLKESKGRENDVNNNFDTLTDVCAEQGRDVDEVLETRARELVRIKELEEKYDIKFPIGQAAADNESTEGKEDEEDEENGEEKSGRAANALSLV